MAFSAETKTEYSNNLINARVAHTLFFMYALQQQAQCFCPRVLTLASPSFLTVADAKGPPRRIGGTHEKDPIWNVGLFSASEDCGHHLGVAASVHDRDNP